MIIKNNNKNQNKYSLIHVLMYTSCLFPFSVNINNDGISANYLYILIALILILINGLKNYAAIHYFMPAIFIYTVIFFIALLYQLSYLNLIERRIISFLIFMSIFIFIFIKINTEMINSFKIAIVLFSVLFSLKAIINYILFLVDSSQFNAFSPKDAIGTQRIGFIYLIAFWVLFFFNQIDFKSKFIKYFLLLIVLSGIFLTFSRSSIVALLGSICLYIFNLMRKIEKINLIYIQRLLLLIICFFISFYLFVLLLDYFSISILRFYKDNLFSLTTADGEDYYNLSDYESSEGVRIYIWLRIIDYVMNNPFTGSGFLGVWVIFDGSGSAHNQFADVLFRTGVFGFTIYCILLYKLLIYLSSYSSDLFWGIIGVIIYGLFHETFKESQGAFILAFLLGIFANNIRHTYIKALNY